jgi:hypothetical protein
MYLSIPTPPYPAPRPQLGDGAATSKQLPSIRGGLGLRNHSSLVNRVCELRQVRAGMPNFRCVLRGRRVIGYRDTGRLLCIIWT